jgi:hypothetical protein
MAIVINATVGDPAANSYITLVECEEILLAEILVGSWATATTANKNKALIQSMRLIEQITYKGFKTTKEQALSFPRKGIILDNDAISEDTIPDDIKLAQALTAMSIINTASEPAALGMTSLNGVYRIKVDDAEIDFKNSYKNKTGLNALPANAQYYARKYAQAMGQVEVVRG